MVTTSSLAAPVVPKTVERDFADPRQRDESRHIGSPIDRDDRRAMRATLARFGVYSGALLGLVLSLPLMFDRSGTNAFEEGGTLESLQLATIVATALLCTVCAGIRPAERGPICLLAGLAAIAAIRELDTFLNARIPGGWKGIAALVALATAVAVWRHRATFLAATPRLVRSTAFPLMWVGSTLVVVIAQLVGHGPTLHELLSDGYARLAKRYIEESIEAVGYMILLFGAIELALMRRIGVTGARSTD